MNSVCPYWAPSEVRQQWASWTPVQQQNWFRNNQPSKSQPIAQRPTLQYTPGSKAATLVDRIQRMKENVGALHELWVVLVGEPTPTDNQFIIWLNRYEFDVIEWAFGVVAQWLSRHAQALELISIEEHREPTQEEIDQHTKTLLDMIRYASGTMSKKSKADADRQA